MSNYKMIQLTNDNVGVVTTGSYLPLGAVTRSIATDSDRCDTFNVTTTGANIVYINSTGFYDISYCGSFSITAVGPLTIALVYNLAKTAMDRSGRVEYMGIYFNSGDVDTLYEYIKRG